MKEFLLLPAVGGIFIFMYEMLKKFDAFCDANRQNLWLEEDAVPEEKEESAEQVMDDCLSSSVSAERNGRLEKLLAAFQREKKVQNFRDLFTSILILLAASVMGYFFNSLGFANANIMTVFVFAVQLIAVLTNHRTYSMIAAVLSVLIFNFLFTTPRYTFHAYGEGYPVTFLIMFGIAFLTGTLALKLKNQAKQSEMVAFRTKILFDTNQILQCARGREEIISKTGQQLRKLLGRNVIFYSVKDHELEKSKVFMMEDREWSEQQKLKKEKYVAEWVLKHRKRAGAGTGNFPGAECLYLTVGVNETVYGVLGISIEKKQLESFEKSILQAIIGECALALENEQITIEKEKAAILAKNEQLRSNLLRAISHDLRTPLTSISGNASNLLSNADYFDKETKKQLYLDIYDDSMWLINLIENMLSVTRLEEGRMNLNISVELVDDVIQEALRHVDRKKDEHTITVEHEDELLLARMDSRLIVQMVINLVDNAIKYTQKGSHIDIRTGREGKNAVISVADDGPGISDEMKEHIFETFYTGTNKIADSRRSLGLGLALCKSIVMEQFFSLHYQQGRYICMNKPRILVVEDDNSVKNLITTTLKAHDYHFLTAENGEVAILEAASHNPEIMLLDLGLPDIDGIEVIKRVRTWSQMPIIVISARSEDVDKIEALDAGADDYLTKPFSVEELLARLRVTRRRLQMMKSDALNQSAVFVNGDLRIDYAAGCVYLGEEELHLTPIEYKLLCLLAQNAGRVLTHTFIMENIWGSNWEKDIASLRVFMATLRRKLEKNPQSLQYIQTHVGVGYRMMKFEESSENKKGEY